MLIPCSFFWLGLLEGFNCIIWVAHVAISDWFWLLFPLASCFGFILIFLLFDLLVSVVLFHRIVSLSLSLPCDVVV